MEISRRAFLRGFSATAGIAALAGCGLLGQLDPTNGEGIGIIAPARNTDQPDPNSTPTAEPDTWHMGAPMPTPEPWLPARRSKVGSTSWAGYGSRRRQ